MKHWTTTLLTVALCANTYLLGIEVFASSILPENNMTTQSSNSDYTQDPRRLKSSIRIDAPPDIVWKAIHEQRNRDADIAYTKVISHPSESETLIEQKFRVVPIYGTAICQTKHLEIPNKRIDYRLVSSDHFKALEGTWLLTPIESGRSTMLELSSFADLGLPIPIPRIFAEKLAKARIEKRLASVKKFAEDDQETNRAITSRS